MSRCYKVHSYLHKQSTYAKCVSEILQPQTHNNKRVLGGKTWTWICNCKKFGQG